MQHLDLKKFLKFILYVFIMYKKAHGDAIHFNRI